MRSLLLAANTSTTVVAVHVTLSCLQIATDSENDTCKRFSSNYSGDKPSTHVIMTALGGPVVPEV